MSRRFLAGITQVVLLIIVLTGCDDDPLDVDISGIEVNQSWQRLDEGIAFDTTAAFAPWNDALRKEYGQFYSQYIQRIVRLGHVDDPALKYALIGFLSDPAIQQVFAAVQAEFESVDQEQQALEQAFRYYRYHFPDALVPNVVTFVAGFDYNVAVTDSTLGIGLEHYLGVDHPLYKQVGIPAYRMDNADRAYMPFDALRGWLLSELGNVGEDNLLAIMVAYGKILYVMDACFLSSPDQYKIGFTETELNWCSVNEWEVWTRMINSQALYSTDPMVIRDYIGEGPFTPGMPRESPSRIGYWVGWQIVRQFMQEHPELSVPQLLELTDAQYILRESRYKPNK